MDNIQFTDLKVLPIGIPLFNGSIYSKELVDNLIHENCPCGRFGGISIYLDKYEAPVGVVNNMYIKDNYLMVSGAIFSEKLKDKQFAIIPNVNNKDISSFRAEIINI